MSGVGQFGAGAASGGGLNPWKWGGAYALYAAIMIAWADSEKGEVAEALAWLVLLGSIAYWWNPLGQHLGHMTGVGFGRV